jgi:UDP-N-acetylmuramate: L-alanyl-gamma-D-glutamyl-meso-diaminopimelate ligase
MTLPTVEDLARTVEDLARTIAARAHPHDVVAILSNGGFGGLHRRLLTLLEERFAG